jgi:type II restriction/modification system DNA methylase subunit YeeA
MNTAPLKAYAPQARRDFIAAVTARAAACGLTVKRIEPIAEQGDVALIGGKAFPRTVAAQRRKLEERIQQQGFAPVIEAVAYTWFNRFMAIRYMELHGYLEHGRRVLSHPDKEGAFEILDACTEIDLPGVNRERVIELKLDGRKDEELYRLLLLGQCHALHQAMPFLFEPIDDETELLLPDNLTKTDSIVRRLVDDIPEDTWDNIEIVGWLYQFYISEKKDQVIGKVVKSEDIPAATQLFTPNWIVKYMVQNSLGAQWLATYPDSKLKGQMEYYIEPAEQTKEVGAALAAITPTSLNPEELTLIDPACGSGHILVEAYELLKDIYLERGYRQKDLPKLILEKNLFGLEICPRAAQLTGFALMMKGRADDRRLFERGVKLNVMALQDNTSLDAESLTKSIKLADYQLKPSDLTALKELFEHAATFGSLIQVPEDLAMKLPALKRLSEATSQDLFVSEALKRLGSLVQQTELLATQYDAVVANPPYMGTGGMNALVKKFAKDNFPDAKSDLFACFIERGFTLAKASGHNAMVTMQSWMFLSSFETMRERMLREATIRTMAHLGSRAFGSISGEVVQTAACVLKKLTPGGYRPAFFRLLAGGEQEKRNALVSGEKRYDRASQAEFKKIPGSPIAYWASSAMVELFTHPKVGQIAKTRLGMATADNDLFVRQWSEVASSDTGLRFNERNAAAVSNLRWFPYQKGGVFRKWYGNLDLVVDWQSDGQRIQNFKDEKTGKVRSHNYNLEYIFRQGVTWNALSSSLTSARISKHALFDNAGSSLFCNRQADQPRILAFLNSRVVVECIKLISPTLNYQPGDIAKLPGFFDFELVSDLDRHVELLTDFSRTDWDAYERSWDFQCLPLLTASPDPTPTLESSYTAWITKNCGTIAEMKRLEEENNRLFIDAYGLQDELTPDVPIEQITLTVNPAYRYGGKLTEEELWSRFRQDTMEELVSYAIGCLMGRYSLGAPGLIYAHSGNEGFDARRYATFPADDDGIVPLTDTEWFDDDAANRLVEYIAVAWDKSHLEDNLTFLADNLSPRRNESSRETLRRYLCDSFFKNHLQSYKKRPIYWLFSSGKQQAFQCLVYLHRYNEGTLARMRTKYVIPLQGMLASRIDQRADDIMAATSTAHRKRLEKERDKLIKQRTELQQFDEQLRHYADQRINLDLDDGVKVNYGKFGDLLAEVKAVTGEAPQTEDSAAA